MRPQLAHVHLVLLDAKTVLDHHKLNATMRHGFNNVQQQLMSNFLMIRALMLVIVKVGE